jgi:uridine kinase
VSETLTQRITRLVDHLGSHGRTAIAIDGADAAGKTTLAERVAAAASVPVCRASVDGFHAPVGARRKRGDLSPEGYYRDCFDYPALIDRLVSPFLAGAEAVETQVYDRRAEQVSRVSEPVSKAGVLLVDGVFLLRPGLRELWTVGIYLDVSEQETLARAVRRDAAFFGSRQTLIERYQRRYLPGQALYRDEAQPMLTADIVVDNEDPASPRIVTWNPATG